MTMGWCAEVSLLQTQLKNFGAMYVDQNIEAQRSTRFCYNEFTQFASRGIYESPLCSEKTEASQLHCTFTSGIAASTFFIFLVLSFHSEACSFPNDFSCTQIASIEARVDCSFSQLKNALLGLHCVINHNVNHTQKKRYKLRYLL